MSDLYIRALLHNFKTDPTPENALKFASAVARVDSGEPPEIQITEIRPVAEGRGPMDDNTLMGERLTTEIFLLFSNLPREANSVILCDETTRRRFRVELTRSHPDEDFDLEVDPALP